MATELVCPKCHGAMRTYERNAVHVDQCVDCRGIFLDRGELEALLNAEAAYNQAAPSSPPRAAYVQDSRPREEGYKDYKEYKDYKGGYDPYRHKKHKQKSFLSELFD